MIDLSLYDAECIDWHTRLAPPAAGQVHLWYWTDQQSEGDWLDWLDESESEHHAKLASEELRHRYLAAHGGVRRLLASYLGCEPRGVPLRRGLHGKPMIHGTQPDALPLEFNLSHTSGHVVAAVAGEPVGVDIEALRPVSNRTALAAKHFTRSELERLQSLAGDAAAGYFFRTWTRKEAAAKLTGLGLAAPVQQFSTGASPTGVVSLPRSWGTPITTCWLADVAAHSATRAAVACTAEPGSITCYRPLDR